MYPLDGGRILKYALAAFFSKGKADGQSAERKAERICKGISLVLSILLFLLFLLLACSGRYNLSLFLLSLFLLFGCLGNKDKSAVYEKMDFSAKTLLKKGVVIRRVAIFKDCPVKDILRFISRGEYLVLEMYDEREKKLFELPQNEFARVFSKTATPYTPIGEFFPFLEAERVKSREK